MDAERSDAGDERGAETVDLDAPGESPERPPRPPIEPEPVDLENAAFVVLGVLLTVVVFVGGV
jgi:hypothetical protein